MNYSEEAIGEAFLELLDEKPFNKITVKDIVERCGVNRNTFYYHFQDIPSLLEEILRSRIDLLIEKHCEIGSLKECITIIVTYFLENKKAVMHVYRSLSREVFISHLDRMLLYLVQEYIDNISATMKIREKDRMIIVRFFKCMLMGIFLDWLDADMGYDLLKDSIRICELQENAGLQFLQNAGETE